MVSEAIALAAIGAVTAAAGYIGKRVIVPIVERRLKLDPATRMAVDPWGEPDSRPDDFTGALRTLGRRIEEQDDKINHLSGQVVTLSDDMDITMDYLADVGLWGEEGWTFAPKNQQRVKPREPARLTRARLRRNEARKDRES